ncbi:MAG: IS200/IS605 family transposase [Acidobacteria bacterium]|nr:IS200/IS605 family transposase [Acidobacteriota bacterium]MCA1643295.1 IS200/IS605 family transposase [Acidobacteriota bacterium]
MPHTFANLLTHIVFSTKDRAPLIKPETRPRLHAYLGGIVREEQGTAFAVNGTADHVHLLVSLPPALSLADAMRVLKTNSSRWMNAAQRAPFAWQSGYGAFSVSRSNAGAVSQYIARQEEHHRKISFREEFIAFLRKHEIEFDERQI